MVDRLDLAGNRQRRHDSTKLLATAGVFETGAKRGSERFVCLLTLSYLSPALPRSFFPTPGRARHARRSLDALGLEGTYDAVYTPGNPARRTNLGYAFVGFLSLEALQG